MKINYKNVIGGIGVGIIFVTHIFMLVSGLPADMMMAHAVINLIAGGMILYSMLKE